MWKQIKEFNLSKMGTKKGYCLQNVRLAYGIGSKFVDAKADMLNNKNKGTLHPMNEMPMNVAVPVYVDSASKYEHVMVCDRGTYYSDGKKLSSVKGLIFFGWGELCEDVRVIEFAEDPKPEPTPEPVKPVDNTIHEGDVVKPKRLISYDGVPLKQYDKAYVVTQLRGDRAVCSAQRGTQFVVWAAMNIKDLEKC